MYWQDCRPVLKTVCRDFHDGAIDAKTIPRCQAVRRPNRRLTGRRRHCRLNYRRAVAALALDHQMDLVRPGSVSCQDFLLLERSR